MKEITLSIAHYEAMQNEQGADVAVEAIRSKIQSHVADYPIALEIRCNSEGEKVASLSFVRAASWKANPNTFRVNLLTCGFAKDDNQSVAGLFAALTKPQVPALVMPADAPEDTPIHENETEVIGLLVGSINTPSLFVRFER